MNDIALSFAKDIRPMFNEIDVSHMQSVGIDLSSRDQVEKYALAIYTTVSDGSMPPPGSGETWSPEMCGRFKQWWDQGCKP
jgi:hypothetical protein